MARIRSRRVSSRPFDPLNFISSTGMDFEKRKIIVSPNYITHVYADSMRQTEKTDSFTASNETVILVDASSGGITITLPQASTVPGKWYWLKKTDNSHNDVVIDGYQDETIEGEPSITLSLQYQYVVILTDGTEWFILGGEYVKINELIQELLDEVKDAKRSLTVFEKHLEAITDKEISKED